MLEQKYKRLSLAIAAGVCTLLILTQICFYSANNKIKDRKNSASTIANTITKEINHLINDKMLYSSALESLSIRDNGEITNFQTVAKKVLKNDNSIRCIQFAKNGLITPQTIYPYKGNENGVGNLLSPNSPRYNAANYALSRRTTVLSVPKDGKLHQGGSGPIARTPIFLTDKNGNEEFWGFSVIIMDFPNLFEQADVNTLSKDYDYNIYVVDEKGKSVLASGTNNISDKPVSSQITSFEMNLQLSLVPKGGWINKKDIRNYVLTSLEISFLVFLLVLYILKSRSLNILYKRLSVTDTLSGCYNKRYFDKKIDKYVDEDIPFVLYILDINRFKSVNDSFGHRVGDMLIQETAKRISSALRGEDTLFRIGGDEFAIISFVTDAEKSKKLIKSILSSVEIPLKYKEKIFEVSLSYGSAAYPVDANRVDKLIELADINMYQQKHEYAKVFPLSGRDHFLLAIKNLISKNSSNNDNSNYYFFHIDYKNFKFINFHYGIEEGNSLVMRTIEHIKEHPNCILCGSGYADSVFFLVKTKHETTREEIENSFNESLNQLLEKEQQRYDAIMLSIWCGYSKIKGLKITDAVGRANVGRVKAKRENINHPVFIDEEQLLRYMIDRQLEYDAMLAMRVGRIIYHLQPQVDVETGKMVSAEVLGRMLDQNGNIIMPVQFVPALESNGMIIDFDLAILDNVCRDLKERIDVGKTIVPVSINLSRMHIIKGNSVEKIKNIIDKYKIPPNILCFEITETLHSVSTEKVSDFCNELHGIGVKISLDDFGAGDTGIGLISGVLIDEIKLDRMFVNNPNKHNKNQLQVMKTVVDMAKKLNIRVVCEGVETNRQFEEVKKIGVNLIQGYYYAKPDSTEKIYEQFL